MTRPMPGPPEPVPHEFNTLPHKLTDDPWPYCSGCAAENRIHLADPKRLTDAECAAEFWRAATVSERARAAQAITRDPGDYLSVAKGFLAASREQITWHRFATRPHALEES